MTPAEAREVAPFSVTYDGEEVTVSAKVRTEADLCQLIRTIGLLGSWVIENQEARIIQENRDGE